MQQMNGQDFVDDVQSEAQGKKWRGNAMKKMFYGNRSGVMITVCLRRRDNSELRRRTDPAMDVGGCSGGPCAASSSLPGV